MNSIPRLLFFLFLFLMSCSGNNPVLERQQAKVTQAQTELHQERALLTTLHDSLQTEIQRNIALGIPKEQAQSIEQARIKAQATIVVASEKNLAAQQTLLDSLTKYHP